MIYIMKYYNYYVCIIINITAYFFPNRKSITFTYFWIQYVHGIGKIKFESMAGPFTWLYLTLTMRDRDEDPIFLPISDPEHLYL